MRRKDTLRTHFFTHHFLPQNNAAMTLCELRVSARDKNKRSNDLYET